MDILPWHLHLKIYKNIGIDGLRSLNIKPGKLNIPQNLKNNITKTFKYKQNGILLGSTNNIIFDWYSKITIPIKNTTKTYTIKKRSDTLYEYFINLEKLYDGESITLQSIIIHRNKEYMKDYCWCTQIILK